MATQEVLEYILWIAFSEFVRGEDLNHPFFTVVPFKWSFILMDSQNSCNWGLLLVLDFFISFLGRKVLGSTQLA